MVYVSMCLGAWMHVTTPVAVRPSIGPGLGTCRSHHRVGALGPTALFSACMLWYGTKAKLLLAMLLPPTLPFSTPGMMGCKMSLHTLVLPHA